ncbi:MAG: MFS transporter [Ktedonobacteraceae bacterium]|nr:MFS transporter [Ktedonobacteraceae bacterium]
MTETSMGELPESQAGEDVVSKAKQPEASSDPETTGSEDTTAVSESGSEETLQTEEAQETTPNDETEPVQEASSTTEVAPTAESAQEETVPEDPPTAEVVQEETPASESPEVPTAAEEAETTPTPEPPEQSENEGESEAHEDAAPAESNAGEEVVAETIAAAEALTEEPATGLPVPDKPQSPLWVGLYMLASLVGGLSSVCIKQLLLPLQVQQLDPQNYYISFLIVASLGAFAGLIASPLSGALSDRTTLRWGRRRPWITGSVITLGIGLLIMAFAPNVPVLLVGEIIAQLGADTLLATSTAVIPDQVPPVQRSVVAAFNGMAPIVGGTVGLLLVTRLTNPTPAQTSQGYLLLAVVSLVLVGVFLLVLRERRLPEELVPPFRAREFFGGFVIRPKRYPGFLYVVGSRFLIFLSFTMLGAYTLFYLQSLRVPNASQNVALFQLISTIFVLVGAIAGGWLSKVTNRLKPFVIGGALLMAVALLIIGFVPSWDIIRIAAIIFGMGFGLYLGVDIALAVRVLPDARSSGKDLGILHMAIFLALILSPIFGSGSLTLFHNNFTLVFGIAALSSLLGAALILPVRSAR